MRIHSQCLTGDVFHSLRCDCRAQLELSLKSIAAEGRGLLIYEHQEGRGIGLLNKLRAYELQDQGADTVEANERLGFESDLRNYELPGEILRYFGLPAVRLLSNNPDKVAAVERAGVAVVERVPCQPTPSIRPKCICAPRKKRWATCWRALACPGSPVSGRRQRTPGHAQAGGQVEPRGLDIQLSHARRLHDSLLLNSKRKLRPACAPLGFGD